MKATITFVSAVLLIISAINVHAEGAIQLPKTGQTTCYNGSGAVITCTGTGQDGDIQAGAAWPNPRFTSNSDQTITDNLTGLIWTPDAGTPEYTGSTSTCVSGTRTWTAALDYVACLNTNNYLGHNDWRLPNENELESLVNVGQPHQGTWLSTQGFTNIQATNHWYGYWSSSTSAGDTTRARIVDMEEGYMGDINKTANKSVWPVRGTSVIWKTGQTQSYYANDDGALQKGVSWPSPRFTDNGNTVSDGLTGLIWTKDARTPGPAACNPAQSKTWQAALDYVKCLNTNGYLGYNDWRLSNWKELMSLVDLSKSFPALPAGHPFTINLQEPWSSSNNESNATFAWTVFIGDGTAYYYSDKSSKSCEVWPVRGGQVGPSPVNGTCGSSNGGTFSSVPASNLCSAGTGSSVSGSGPWSWSCTGSNGGTTATCSANLQQQTQVTLTVTKSGAGSGTITANSGTLSWGGNTGTASYNSGASVTLTASAASGSTFTGWSGGECSGTGTCVLTMDSAKNVTATFGITPTPVNGTCGSSNGGAFTSAPASNLCSAGTASSVSGSGPWTWSCTGSGGGMSANCSASPQQQQTQFTLTVTKSGTGNGSVAASTGTLRWNGNTGTASYNSGTNVTLTAATDTGSTFTGWSGSGCSSTGTCAVTMAAAKNVAATFTLNSPGPAGAIQLPKTGQTTKYFAGDDGDLRRGAAWPDPRFHDNTDGTVTDSLTGLIWTKNANAPGPAACSPGSGKEWAEALAYTACLNTNSYLGHNDWRLPNVNELSSLIDYSKYDTALPSGHPFSNATSNGYWSSSAYIACYSGFALEVHMQYGDIMYQNKAVSLLVWPVRGQCATGSTACVPKTGQTASCAAGDDGTLQAGVAWPANRFTDNNDGTVTDNLTGLMWLKDANCMKTSDDYITMQTALGFISGINSGQYSTCRAGHSDWRLPNINEFNSLTDRLKGDLPAGNPFLNVLKGYVSSTARAVTTSNAWGMDLSNGTGLRGSTAWPVRSDPVTFKVTVAPSGTGSGAVTSVPAGINCGLDCSENYSSGTSVTLTASAFLGSTFAGWSGSGCSGTSTCSLTLNADTTVTATFTRDPIGKGDISYDGQVNLTDAILALQVIAGISPQQIIYKEADVNSDGKIGLADAIYILQQAAGMR